MRQALRSPGDTYPYSVSIIHLSDLLISHDV
jgi:hypothetical protein